MRKFLRFKLEGARLLEVEISKIQTFSIDKLDSGDYVLAAFSESQMYELCYGNLSEVHTMLNTLHEMLDITVTDVHDPKVKQYLHIIYTY